MVMLPLPSRTSILLVWGATVVLAALAFAPLATLPLRWLALGLGGIAATAVVLDAALSRRRWQRGPLVYERQLPQAFAVGQPTTVRVRLDNTGDARLTGELYEHPDGGVQQLGMPLRFSVGPRQRQVLEFTILPTLRGMRAFAPAQIRLRSCLGLLDMNLRIGESQARRVFPNFVQQGRFALLAGDRRLNTPGLKNVQRRGSGTDFDQLIDYSPGDPIRHIDWKATRRHDRPIVRKFRDDRDQSVMFLLDCGRRMRADDTQQGIGATHFDQSLNALMLLAFVALSQGDAVGAMTFGTPPGAERCFAPRKGRQTLNALMAGLAEVEPSPTFSDYGRAASDLLHRQRKRGLLVLITNCRNEDASELGAALRLLRTRHLVVLANLREQVVADIEAQPLVTADHALEVAAALQYSQSRKDFLNRLAQGGVLLIDCEPRRLGVELVNRYRVLKSTGSI